MPEPEVFDPEVVDSEVDDPLLEEPEPEFGELVDPEVAPGVGRPALGVLLWVPLVLVSAGEGVALAGDVTSRGASGDRAGTRSGGVERSRPATT